MLILMRHGRSLLNDKKKLCGESDPKLTTLGITQGIIVGNWLKQFEIKKIFTSSTYRSTETAKLINQTLNIGFTVCDELRERNYGRFEMMPIDKLIEERQNLNHYFADSTQDWHDIKDVESDLSIYKRVSKLIKKEYPNNLNGSILLVTHAGTIKSYLYGCLNISPNRTNCIKVRNASLIVLDYHTSNQLQLKGLYDFDFLNKLFST